MTDAARFQRIASRVAQGPVIDKEGTLAVTIGEVIAHMNHFLGARYTVEMSYRSFADRVKGPFRDSLVDHWHEHAKEERQASYDLAMKIVGLGADPIQSIVEVPQCPPSLKGFCMLLAKQELDAIEAGRKLVAMAGENAGLRILAEEGILMDSQHLDDLRRMCVNIDPGD